jgi:hypothetical protein
MMNAIQWTLILCMVGAVVPTATAQLQPDDFDVPDGRIENAAANRLMGSGYLQHRLRHVAFCPGPEDRRFRETQSVSGRMKIASTTFGKESLAPSPWNLMVRQDCGATMPILSSTSW